MRRQSEFVSQLKYQILRLTKKKVIWNPSILFRLKIKRRVLIKQIGIFSVFMFLNFAEDWKRAPGKYLGAQDMRKAILLCSTQ